MDEAGSSNPLTGILVIQIFYRKELVLTGVLVLLSQDLYPTVPNSQNTILPSWLKIPTSFDMI